MTLGKYLKDISKYPLLTDEQEYKLAKKIKDSDIISRENFINSNLRLVVNIAKKYSNNGNLEDLIEEGNVGLITAVDKFNPDLGYRFSSYATWWIKQGIFSFFEDQSKIKLPSEKNELKKKIDSIIEQYINANGKEPSYEYISGELNKNQDEKIYSPKEIDELFKIYENISVFSLNRSLSNDSEYTELIAGDDGRKIIHDISNKSLADVVYKHITNLNLDNRTKTVLERFLYENKSFNEIAEELEIKREQVKQKYHMGLRVLRNSLKNTGIFNNEFLIKS